MHRGEERKIERNSESALHLRQITISYSSITRLRIAPIPCVSSGVASSSSRNPVLGLHRRYTYQAVTSTTSDAAVAPSTSAMMSMKGSPREAGLVVDTFAGAVEDDAVVTEPTWIIEAWSGVEDLSREVPGNNCALVLVASYAEI